MDKTTQACVMRKIYEMAARSLDRRILKAPEDSDERADLSDLRTAAEITARLFKIAEETAIAADEASAAFIRLENEICRRHLEADPEAC